LMINDSNYKTLGVLNTSVESAKVQKFHSAIVKNQKKRFSALFFVFFCTIALLLFCTSQAANTLQD
jgi:hypothetical protein